MLSTQSKQNKINYLEAFSNLSVAILIFIVSIFALSTIGFIFKLNINFYYVLFSLLLSIFYFKKQTKTQLEFLFYTLGFLFILCISSFIALNLYDNSWDGRSSHYAEMILLKNGWNPIYDNYKDFCKTLRVYEASAFWGNSYMRFFEVVGANFYKYFGLIESTKTTNFLMLFACFFYSFVTLKTFIKKYRFIPLILSLAIISNPIVICQLFTNYIDINLYFAFTFMVLAIIKNPFFKKQNHQDCLIFLLSTLILSTCKFSAMAYCFIICLAYLSFLLYKRKNISHYIASLFAVLILFAITTISPLYTNFKNFNHPFHPIMGKNKINIFTPDNYPEKFKNKSLFYKFYISTFSESINTIEDPPYMNVPIKLKIPFTISIEKPHNLINAPDIRICGFGYLWSGILCLNLLLLFFLKFRNKKDKELFFLLTLIIALSTFSNPECWYARYVPQQWLFPIFSIMFYVRNKNKNKIFKIIKIIITTLITSAIYLNSLIIATLNTFKTINDTRYFKNKYQKIKNYSPNGIYLLRIPAWENMAIADESTIPHLQEKIKKIIFIEPKNIDETFDEYYSVHNYLTIYRYTYYFKPIQLTKNKISN